MCFHYSLITLNRSKNEVVHSQSNVNWYWEGRVQYTHYQWHVVCGQFTKYAVYHHLRATISQHCQHYQPNADFHQHTYETEHNMDSLTTGVGYGQSLPHQKAGHFGVPEESSRDTTYISFNNGTVPGKTGRMGTLFF